MLPEDFLKQRIFDPLGMADTAFYVPPDKLGRFCATYGPDEKGGLKVVAPVNSPTYTRLTKCPSGGGGLVSTATDYWRFAQMLLNQGELDGVRLLGRKTVEFMMTDHLPAHVHPFDEAAFGFGLRGNVL
jgi:CubicO group peptidase (beta-lactamase class C family)